MWGCLVQPAYTPTVVSVQVWGGSLLLHRNVCGRQNPSIGVLDADCAHFAEAPRLVGRHAEGMAGVAVAVRAHGDVLLVAVRVVQNVGQPGVWLPGQEHREALGLPHHGRARSVMDDNRPRRGGWRWRNSTRVACPYARPREAGGK